MVNLHTDLVSKPQRQMHLLSHPFILYLHEKILQTHPLTPHSASPKPLCHVFDHGLEWRIWRVLTAPLPSCCQALCHYSQLAQPSAAAALALSTTSSKADALCVCMCLCPYLWLCANTYACTLLHACLHLLTFVCIGGIVCCYIWNSLPCVNG